MELQAISGAAFVALGATLVFFFVAGSWSVVLRAADTATPRFGNRILREAAQRFRDELQGHLQTLWKYLATLLAFAVLFSAAYFLNAGRLLDGYPDWQLYLLLLVFGVAGSYAVFGMLRAVLLCRQASFLRDANVAIGQQLRQLPASFARLFHDVPTAAGVIDHVVVSRNGIYTIQVLAKRCRKRGDARLVDHQVHFSTSIPDESIVSLAARAARLQKELRQATGTGLTVRSVVAVPGWDIGDQISQEHLLVNENNVNMLCGWKDSEHFLMDEDVAVVVEELSQRCRRR